MSEERKQILNLLAVGKISVDQAERLMGALGESAAPRQPSSSSECCVGEAAGCCDGAADNCCEDTDAACCETATAGAAHPTAEPRKTPKYICVRVDGPDKVNVRVPIALLRAGMKLGALLPKDAKGGVQARLAEQGINLDLNGKNLDEMLSHLHDINVDVVQKDGQKVKVCCE